MSDKLNVSTLVPLAAAARQIGDDDRPVQYVSVLRAAQRLGLVEYDSQGRAVIPQKVVDQFRASYRASGYLHPRRRCAGHVEQQATA
jgi:hypothetical protein